MDPPKPDEDEEEEGKKKLSNPTHEDTLTHFMLQMYDNGNHLTDVTVHCDSHTFHAHRIVLSHYSDFFRVLFENLTGVVGHFDVFLEGFSVKEIEAVLLFMYTGGVICCNGEGSDAFLSASTSLCIPSLTSFLEEQQQRDHDVVDEHSPVGVWEKCSPDTEVTDDNNKLNGDANKVEGGNNHNRSRKQARPQRHTATPSPPTSRTPSPHSPVSSTSSSNSFEDLYDEDMVEEPHENSGDELEQDPPPPPQPPPPPPEEDPKQEHVVTTPPEHQFMFLRNMINTNAQAQPPPPHFFSPPQFCVPHPVVHHHHPGMPLHHHHPQQKRILKDKVLWGKIMKHQHFHATSRAQHSAPRGGPPRAWSNQDLTEALHNVWNKKMTTSQASRIFGIPYNSLLMYVRGKYGKSLKLDLLKKGLDLALLEKQQKLLTSKQTSSAHHPPPPQPPSSPTVSQPTKSNKNVHQQNNVVEWMMMSGGGGGGSGPQFIRPGFNNNPQFNNNNSHHFEQNSGGFRGSSK